MPNEPKPRTSRSTFTNAQRLQICRHYEANPSLTQTQLAAWAQEAFGMPRTPSQAMISKVLKRKSYLEAASPAVLASKNFRQVRLPEVDAALARWFIWCEGKGIAMTGEQVKAKAARFAELLNVQTNATWSNGWLQRFYNRHGLKSFKGKEENSEAGEMLITQLQRKLQGYELHNIFCVGETGLLYAMSPERRNFGESKKRLTIALACNADDSERLPPLFVGKAEKPRGFTATTAVEFDYTSSSKGLMTRAVFEKWVKDVDLKFRLQNRKCILLLDAVAVHGGVNASELTNVELAFLPIINTSNLQPLNAGIIDAFKRRYRKRQIEQALDRIDAVEEVDNDAAGNHGGVYGVGVCQALSWCLDCWTAIPGSIFLNCWKSTGLLDYSAIRIQPSKEEISMSDELTSVLSFLRMEDPLSAEELLNPPEENVIEDEPSDEFFCGIGEYKAVEGDHDVQDGDGELSIQDLKERLKWIGTLFLHAETVGVPANQLSGLRILQRQFREELKRKEESIGVATACRPA